MKHQKGTALVTALMGLSLSFVLVLMVLSTSLSASGMTGKRRDSEVAFNLAEAGLQHAVASLREDPEYAGEASRALGGGTFSVSVASTDDPNYCNVVSTGHVAGSGAGSTRQVTALVRLTKKQEILNYGIVTKGPMRYAGSAIVDSIPKPGKGKVHSNTSVDMSGASLVRGSVSSAGPITGGGKATGGFFPFSGTVEFPYIDTAAVRAEAEKLGVSGSIKANSNEVVYLRGLVNGDVTLSGNARLVILGTTFVTGNVTLTGSGYSGTGSIYSQGDVKLSGGSSVTTEDLSSVAVVALSASKTALTITGNSHVGGFIYVPNGTCVFTGSGLVDGTLAANNLNMTGNATVNHNQNLRWGGQARPSIAAWSE